MEFEGRAPIDPDAEGISQLLQRLFPRAQINCNQLAQLLIGNNSSIMPHNAHLY